MSRFDGRRILIVEDEVIIGMMATDMLEDMGATVLGPAMNVAQGVSIAETEQADAALVDINLDGARSDPVVEVLARRGVPIVYTTGYGRAAAPGEAHTVLEKPYTADALARALARALDEDA
ncbi:MAG TPA: response regulator [Paracoccaceae bacterium]|nr:response regulator [Paracoccaceae bacterium]